MYFRLKQNMKQPSARFFGMIILHACIQLTISLHPFEFAEIVQELRNLLDVDVPPEGQEFPRVTGPNPHDDVCIVGAGPAGIHMALSLKDQGYKQITMFEKTGRAGGKIKDLQFDGYYHAHGASFTDKFSNIVGLAKRYNVGETHPVYSPGVSKEYVAPLF